MRVGGEGDGWKQVTTELAFERSGPERYLSSIALVVELIRAAGRSPDPRAAEVIGRLVAQLVTLRQMSLSVAGMLQAGQNPNLEAAVVKDVGTTFEQSIPEIVHALLDLEPTIDSGTDLQQTLGYLVQRAPVLLAPRRHPRGAARHHRARTWGCDSRVELGIRCSPRPSRGSSVISSPRS